MRTLCPRLIFFVDVNFNYSFALIHVEEVNFDFLKEHDEEDLKQGYL